MADTTSDHELVAVYGFQPLFGTDAAAAAGLATAEPQLVYARKLRESPVVRNSERHVGVLRMADVLYLNKHKQVLGTGAHGNSMGGARPLIPLDLDGPEHTKYRKLLDPLFSPTKVARLEPAVRKLAGELIDTFIGEGQVDIYNAWCQPLPASIFLSIMGVPESDLAYFLSFKNAILNGEMFGGATDQMTSIANASVACYGYFDDVIADRTRRGEPGDDIIGWLLTAEVDGLRLTPEQVQDICYLLMIAGLDTVAASLACMICHFARAPHDRARVVADPSLWPSAVEELMRFESPVTEGHRFPQVDVTLPSGEVIPAGTTVTVSWSAADLDPEAFDDPLEVRLDRGRNAHIAFASGWHRCLGSHLARMELRAALDELHRRIPDYRLADGFEPHFTGNPRKPDPLPIVWR
jgi:cytochrome P450